MPEHYQTLLLAAGLGPNHSRIHNPMGIAYHYHNVLVGSIRGLDER